MRPLLLRWLAALLLGAVCCLPVLAQPGASTNPPATVPVPINPDTGEPSAPVLQTFVAFVCTIIVLLIVCMPSRKG
jgi:hypothetical protein